MVTRSNASPRSVHFLCSQCGKHLRARLADVGKLARCTGCGERQRIPMPQMPPQVSATQTAPVNQHPARAGDEKASGEDVLEVLAVTGPTETIPWVIPAREEPVPGRRSGPSPERRPVTGRDFLQAFASGAVAMLCAGFLACGGAVALSLQDSVWAVMGRAGAASLVLVSCVSAGLGASSARLLDGRRGLLLAALTGLGLGLGVGASGAVLARLSGALPPFAWLVVGLGAFCGTVSASLVGLTRPTNRA